MAAATSAKVSDHHIPSAPPIRMGSSVTDKTRKNRVCKSKIAAETAPFESAVKNDDEKMLKPESTNEKAKIINARSVRYHSRQKT